MRITYTCQWCCETVTKRRSPATMKVPPRYCSQRCNGAAKRGTGSGHRVTHEFDCANCGYRIRVYRSPSAQTPRYCSVKCIGESQRGDANPSFVTGSHIDDNGYIRVRVHGNRYEYEHRLIAAKMIGRTLDTGEVVHHINGIKTDNRPDNLEVLASQSEHMKIHAKLRSA